MKHRQLIWSLAFCLVIIVIAGTRWRLRSATTRPSRDLLDAPLSRTVDDPASSDADSINWAGARDFRFTMGDGSGWQGYNVLQVGADGQCTYTFIEAPGEIGASGPPTIVRGKRATFVLDPATLVSFRNLLKSVDFFRMKKEYHAEINDGSQRWARVEASGHRKAVYCNNFFPPAFLRISRFVNDRIIAPNSTAVSDAVTVTLELKDMELEEFR